MRGDFVKLKKRLVFLLCYYALFTIDLTVIACLLKDHLQFNGWSAFPIAYIILSILWVLYTETDAYEEINLLREGLDLPQVSLVAILDADKEGFLRSHRALTQTVGRAARHLNGKAIMYADNITDSMKRTIDETNRRREKQLNYNEKHNIVPQAIKKNFVSLLGKKQDVNVTKNSENDSEILVESIDQYKSLSDLDRAIVRTRKLMQAAAKKMEFIEAAQYRDQLKKLEELKQTGNF